MGKGKIQRHWMWCWWDPYPIQSSAVCPHRCTTKSAESTNKRSYPQGRSLHISITDCFNIFLAVYFSLLFFENKARHYFWFVELKYLVIKVVTWRPCVLIDHTHISQLQIMTAIKGIKFMVMAQPIRLNDEFEIFSSNGL